MYVVTFPINKAIDYFWVQTTEEKCSSKKVPYNHTKIRSYIIHAFNDLEIVSWQYKKEIHQQCFNCVAEYYHLIKARFYHCALWNVGLEIILRFDHSHANFDPYFKTTNKQTAIQSHRHFLHVKMIVHTM